MTLAQLKTKAQSAPSSPGVYYWYNQEQVVIYVGRAMNLRNRLSQYFLKNINSKTAEMMSLASNLKYQETETLLDSIILEAREIKKYWPKYNIVDRDDRSFLYVVIPKTDYPKPIIVRGTDLQKFPLGQNQVFGPYQSYHLLKSALRLVRRVFPYSTCRPGQGQACFDYQIGLCPGVCLNKITVKDYQKNINQLSALLSGSKKRLLSQLQRDNPEKLKALKHLQDVSLLSRESNLDEQLVNRLEAYDVSHLQGQETYGAMVVFENGQANPKEYRLFKIKQAPPGDDERALEEMLKRRLAHPEWPLPELIIIDGGRPQVSYLTKVFDKLNVNIPLLGISELGGDQLVWPAHTKRELKNLATSLKPLLLQMRDEAHRFANRGRQSAFRSRR